MFSVCLLWTVVLLVAGQDCDYSSSSWQFPEQGGRSWKAGNVYEIEGVEWMSKTNNVALKIYIIAEDGQTKSLCGDFAKGSLKANAHTGYITAKCTKKTKGRAAFFASRGLETCGPEKKFWLLGRLVCPPGKVEKDGLCDEEILEADGGTVYTRWSSKSCPSTAELVYSGQAGGGLYGHAGGGSTMHCMHLQPEYTADALQASDKNVGLIYGAEYEYYGGKNLMNRDIPCAVCRVQTRSTQLMIPGRVSCPDNSWTREYYGKLSTGHHTHTGQRPFICLDIGMGTLGKSDGHVNKDGSCIYVVHGQCGSLNCPPYKNNKEVSCVVCSK